MTNEAFQLLTEAERQAKFKAVLNSKTEGCLTGEELNDILLIISLRQQYSVKVYRDVQEFHRKLAIFDDSLSQTIFGQVMEENRQISGSLLGDKQAAAVLVTKMAVDGMVHQIHIFIPPERLQKGYQR